MKNNLENWPPVEGRYKKGNKQSPVAVCTNASVEGIELDMEKVALLGKCVTENIGIEKIIQNIVSNPNIRYLVLCGKVSKGHFVAQAIEALLKNGIDKDKRIVGAKGNMPVLKNLNEKLIERFRKQITPVNIVGETDSKKIEELIDKLLETKPEEFSAQAIKIEKVKEIEARVGPEWIPDPKGFFVISINRKRNKIIAEHYKDNKLTKRIVGNSAEEISKTIVKLKLIGEFKQTKQHAMYLGRELQKAEIALKEGLDYEQDADFNIKKGQKEQKAVNEYEWFD